MWSSTLPLTLVLALAAQGEARHIRRYETCVDGQRLGGYGDRNCYTKCGTDYQGRNLRVITASCFEDCISACSADQLCAGAQFHKDSGECHLKSSLYGPEACSQVDSVVCKKPLPNTTTLPTTTLPSTSSTPSSTATDLPVTTLTTDTDTFSSGTSTAGDVTSSAITASTTTDDQTSSTTTSEISSTTTAGLAACPTDSSTFCPPGATSGSTACVSTNGTPYIVDCGTLVQGTILNPRRRRAKRQQSGLTLQGCQDLCSSQANCVAGNYEGSTCTLFSEVTCQGEPGSVPGGVTFRKATTPAPSQCTASSTSVQTTSTVESTSSTEVATSSEATTTDEATSSSTSTTIGATTTESSSTEEGTTTAEATTVETTTTETTTAETTTAETTTAETTTAETTTAETTSTEETTTTETTASEATTAETTTAETTSTEETTTTETSTAETTTTDTTTAVETTTSAAAETTSTTDADTTTVDATTTTTDEVTSTTETTSETTTTTTTTEPTVTTCAMSFFVNDSPAKRADREFWSFAAGEDQSFNNASPLQITEDQDEQAIYEWIGGEGPLALDRNSANGTFDGRYIFYDPSGTKLLPVSSAQPDAGKLSLLVAATDAQAADEGIERINCVLDESGSNGYNIQCDWAPAGGFGDLWFCNGQLALTEPDYDAQQACNSAQKVSAMVPTILGTKVRGQ